MSRRVLVRLLPVAVATLASVVAASGQEVRPNVVGPKPRAGAPAPDPMLEASRAAFEAMTEAERKAAQDALVWTGDYNAVTAGTFGPRTYQAIVAWQTRAGLPPDGILPKAQRTALDAAGLKLREAARFRLRTDAPSGVTIGVPETLFTKRIPQPGGTRWQSADGRVTLESRSFKTGETDLDALFERATAPAADRKITYKVKKPDFIVVTGETAGGRSYVRYASSPDGVRGFSIGYDKALAGEIDRVVIAIANSFVPFPTAPAAQAPAATVAVKAPSVVVRTETGAPAASGLVVAMGRIVTSSAALASCSSPMIGGRRAEPVRRDASGGLTLLAYEPSPTSLAAPLAVRSDAPDIDEPLVVVAAQAHDGSSVAPAVAVKEGVSAPLQPGAAGAPILDRSGHVVALVADFPAAPRRVAGIVPPTRYTVLPGAALAAFLREAGIPARQVEPTSRSSLGSAAASYIRSVVAITCER